ncbi:hypothetical protein QMK19_11385 [Streptomyces sp. H10-C2]|uniref:hypothetical protein n=1 Tax=unclassified Streptomyces TaxID=2593676 RepID=UPI0024B8F751|nr:MULTISPECIES: hypothetical protein [unclassified Streptomyces]MDJ0340613.1 hypothetical protein [Streptomyces sp. PH10-H1]MDJ0370261.1 hypothetical protein [Streptomyces sp. H10-C2]
MARIGSGTLVTGLTAAALAVIAVLAVQASGSAADHPVRARPSASASTAPSTKAPPPAKAPALPANTGSGKRVVYGLAAKRVWLVDANDKVLRAYVVAPGSVDPVPGRYKVTSRTARGTGGDGIPIEHVVRFATVGNTVIGFSSAVDASMPSPDPQKKTGGIRETPADGDELWKLAVIDTRVVVVR